VDGDELSYPDDQSDSDDHKEIYCCDYCEKEYNTLKGLTCHQNLYCKKSNSNKTNKTNKTNKKSNKNCCYRCGRTGHYEDDCYASTHAKGYII
jgi:hypothetical protein